MGNNSIDNTQSKGIYSAPRLVEYGSIEQLTQGQGWGIKDIFVYGLNDPIGRPGTGS
jgi:hypothetical protein